MKPHMKNKVASSDSAGPYLTKGGGTESREAAAFEIGETAMVLILPTRCGRLPACSSN
jgi:hypothetical protein